MQWSSQISFTTMLDFWLITLGCLAANALEFDWENSHISGENGWYVPYANGSYKWLDKFEAASLLKINNFARSSENSVEFFLYTKLSNDSIHGENIKPIVTSIANSTFNPAHATRIIIHGWLQNHLSNMNRDIRNAWFSLGEYNIIVVDWHMAQSMLYFSVVSAMPGVGQQLADMIDFLVENYKMSLDTLHVIGFSLGAHIAGYAGKSIKTGQIHTIVGLDPALPLFSYDKPEQRLSSSDAFYVESIHTNAGLLGFKKPIGKAAFYINGGQYQPGCILDVTGVCSHMRAITYYIEAVTAFVAVKCSDFEKAVGKNCSEPLSVVRMSSDTNAYAASGSYYLQVIN